MANAKNVFGGKNIPDRTAQVRQAMDKVNRAKSSTHSENTSTPYRQGGKIGHKSIGRPTGKVRKNPGA